jgi:exosortase
MFPDQPKRRLLSVLIALCGCGLILTFGFFPYTYSHTMQLTSVTNALWTMWNIFPDFQYGMAVPVLAGIVIYSQRKKLAILPIKGWWPGVNFVILTLILFWAGHRVDNQYIGFFSIQLLLASLVLWILGWKWLIALAFPLAFLTFTWPMPFLDNLVTFPLRMFMSGLSVSVMNLFGLPTIQNGTGIFSAPNPGVHLAAGELFQVDVADPCSGIRSLYALMMISALYGYFTLQSPWRRGLLFLSSIPLAIAGNLARILILTLGIVSIGAPTAIGSLEKPTWFHEGAGFAVFLVALGGMILIGNLLNSNPAEWRRKWHDLSPRPRTTSAPSQNREIAPDIY